MENAQYVQQFEEFLKARYAKELEKLAEFYPETKSLMVDFAVLDKFAPELADDLIASPDALIKAAEEAIASIGYTNSEGKAVTPNVRFYGLPNKLLIRNINSTHINKLIMIEGVINKITDVRPKVEVAAFLCLRCGRVYKIPQEGELYGRLNEPGACSCERREFKLDLDETTFTDMQKMQIQEPLEALVRGEQAKNLDIWLEDDLTNRLFPGDKLQVVGVLRLIPPKNKGSVYSIYLHALHIEKIEREFEEIELTAEEETRIRELAKDTAIYEKIIASIAPSIYGHKEIKEALAIQLLGGSKGKILPDGVRIRPDMHILLIGDPGCLVADERVALGNGAIARLGTLGERHLQDISTQLLTGQGYKRDTATVFHSYPNQPIMEIVTESGKSIKGTYNHPLLTVRGREREWKRLDEIKPGDRLATVPWIPCTITAPVKTGWAKKARHYGPKPKSRLPAVLDARLAGLMGYVLGDGWVREHRVCFLVAPGEKDLLEPLVETVEESFGVKPSVRQLKPRKGRSAVLTEVDVNDADVAHCLSFLSEKRVPELVMMSGNAVAAEFLAWLFEADGCVFSKGRGKRAIQLKSASAELLRDAQILLLRFGVHSRINERNLAIRRAESIAKFAKGVGFRSAKKKAKLKELVAACKGLHHQRGQARSERVVAVRKAGHADVFDVEVPRGHRFTANGIVSHNTAKSQLLYYIYKLAPKGVFVGGKSATGAGLTATAEKDEFGEGGWTLKAGALVLASGGQACIDEFDKMGDEDRSSMHEAMEQQRISIAKAGIVTTFRAETAILAAANPKYGRFDPYELVADQFNIPPTLLSRFDLIFPIKDVMDEQKDRNMADHILNNQMLAGIRSSGVKGVLSDEEITAIEAKVTPILSADLLRKYIAYARKNVNPVLTTEATQKIKEYYMDLRNLGKSQGNVAITPRQLEALVRIAEGSARGRLSPKVEMEDAERAIRLHRFVMQEIGMDPETGRLDIDTIATGQSKSRADKTRMLHSLIKQLNKDYDVVTKDMILEKCGEVGINTEEFEKLMEILKRNGDVYSPKHNQYKTAEGQKG
jgi:replicative DNA helicase Mcm